MPLIVPREPSCTNPNCPWLHRMPTLLDLAGKGEPVHGEVFELSEKDLEELDRLEGFVSPGNPSNVYERKTISVNMNSAVVDVQAYVIADAASKLDEWERGEADTCADYTLDMASVIPKPR